MVVTAHPFWLPRKGNSPAEYEDAWAAQPASGRYAVADGASEGCFTGMWARLLVEDFVGRAGQGMEPWPTSLSAIQAQWSSDVGGRNLPYHAEPWVRRGAYAAFLGIVLGNSPLPPAVLSRMGEGQGVRASYPPLPPGEGHVVRASYSPLPPGEGQGVRASVPPGDDPASHGARGVRDAYHWQAIAVGDTCLFQTRGGALLHAFPLQDSQQFNNAPKLVGARTPGEEVRHRCRVWPNGRGQPGDRLWLMTDALAQWCLAEGEVGRSPWADLESLLSSATLPAPSGSGAAAGSPGEGGRFAEWIASVRGTRGLRNDDVTLLAIVLEE